MRLRVPLLARILGWLFLNLLLVAGVGYAVFRAQFRFGLDFLLAGRAGDRVQALANGIAAELSEQPRANWNAVLDRFGETHDARFLLLRGGDGAWLAGRPGVVPLAVRERILERRGLPPRNDGPLHYEGPLRGRNAPVRAPGPALPPAMGGPAVGERGRFLVRTQAPTEYWVGVRVRIRDADPARLVPAVLLIVSSSLHGGGLFFDLRPWLVVGGAVAALSALFWIPLVRGITRALAATTRATEQIAEGRFDVRVPARRRDELGQLGEAVNRMAQRIEGLVQGQKRFLGDIAHELCSPLARIQMSLGILEQRVDARHRTDLDELREEVEQMSGLVGELLSFSKAALGARSVVLEPVELQAVAATAVRREGGRGGEVQVKIPAGLRVQASPELLQRALANLLRNALRHAADAGPVTLSANLDAGGSVTVRVQDAGPGVPEASLPRLFDPFYRVDDARTRETGGVGLGLTIVKTCVEACGGTVACRNLEPRGFEVSLRLQAAGSLRVSEATPTGTDRAESP